jgi:hypothetical protein
MHTNFDEITKLARISDLMTDVYMMTADNSGDVMLMQERFAITRGLLQYQLQLADRMQAEIEKGPQVWRK